jgi:hypothetical protein
MNGKGSLKSNVEGLKLAAIFPAILTFNLLTNGIWDEKFFLFRQCILPPQRKGWGREMENISPAELTKNY